MRHKPRKRFGQNFLVDGGILQKIITAFSPQKNQLVVEIGPGLGALTTELLPFLDKLHVIELDRELIPRLQVIDKIWSKLVIHQADALSFDFAEIIENNRKIRVIGNLPYNISTPLIFHLLENVALIEDMHFMLQKEVVERLCAEVGSKAYGRLSVMVQYYCRVENLFVVSPQAFNPRPKVMSAFVRITPYKQLPAVAKDLNVFSEVIKQAFSQRRKMLRNTLCAIIPVEQLENIGIDPTKRAEQISVTDYVKISNRVSNTKGG